jgi:hypothetical protein
MNLSTPSKTLLTPDITVLTTFLAPGIYFTIKSPKDFNVLEIPGNIFFNLVKVLFKKLLIGLPALTVLIAVLAVSPAAAAKVNEIKSIKDSTYTKGELNRELKITGLESEKRMIQATDRKLFDVRRQTEIEEEIKMLKQSK